MPNNTQDRTPLTIDIDFRTINVPTDYVFGVRNDKDVLAVPFIMPRYVDNVDLSELSIRVNFTNSSGLSSFYDVTDEVINDDTIEFSWLLGSAVFTSSGKITFAVCLRQFDEDDGITITKEFNTTTATARILEGLTVESADDPTQYSILATMQNLSDSVETLAEQVSENADTTAANAAAVQQYADSLISIPSVPETDGTYTLQATRIGDDVSYTWIEVTGE